MVKQFSKAALTVIVTISLLLLLTIEDKDNVECHSLARPVRMLRDPMPWEGEYFDPSYHRWPKSSDVKINGEDKKAKRFISDEIMLGGLY